MAKVSFLRVWVIKDTLKPHYARSTLLLNKSRELMSKEGALASEFIRLMSEDTASMRRLGYYEYVDSGVEDLFSAKLKANGIERARLLDESKRYRDDAAGILDWVKETFKVS